jgi:putative heme-binding domain-containing protein
VKGQADVENGRQVFFSPRLGGCAVCHRAEGIGSMAGPELSSIAAVDQVSGNQLLESVLQPNRNVAPRYESFNITTTDGQTRLAFQLHERGGTHSYIDMGGNTFDIKIEDIIKRELLPVSIMPEGLMSRLTDEEVRDLMAYLSQLNAQ